METRLFNFRIDKLREMRLAAMAKATERTASGLVRFLIDQAWSEYESNGMYRLSELGQQALNEQREKPQGVE